MDEVSESESETDNQLKQELLKAYRNDPHLLPGQFFREGTYLPTAKRQESRDRTVVDLHLWLLEHEVVMMAPIAMPYHNQRLLITAEEMINNPARRPALATCFENADQAQMFARTTCEVDVDGIPFDRKYPMPFEVARQLVALLFHACVSVVGSTDSPRNINEFLQKEYDLRLIEVRCWTMLKVSMKRDSYGAELIRPLGYTRSTPRLQRMHLHERIQDLATTLYAHVSRTRQVLAPSMLLQVVDNFAHFADRSIYSHGQIEGRKNQTQEVRVQKESRRTTARNVSSAQPEIIEISDDDRSGSHSNGGQHNALQQGSMQEPLQPRPPPFAPARPAHFGQSPIRNNALGHVSAPQNGAPSSHYFQEPSQIPSHLTHYHPTSNSNTYGFVPTTEATYNSSLLRSSIGQPYDASRSAMHVQPFGTNSFLQAGDVASIVPAQIFHTSNVYQPTFYNQNIIYQDSANAHPGGMVQQPFKNSFTQNAHHGHVAAHNVQRSRHLNQLRIVRPAGEDIFVNLKE